IPLSLFTNVADAKTERARFVPAFGDLGGPTKVKTAALVFGDLEPAFRPQFVGEVKHLITVVVAEVGGPNRLREFAAHATAASSTGWMISVILDNGHRVMRH